MDSTEKLNSSSELFPTRKSKRGKLILGMEYIYLFMSFPWKLSLPNHVCSCFGHTVEDLKVVNFKLITFFVYCFSPKGNSSKNTEGFDTTEVLTSDM